MTTRMMMRVVAVAGLALMGGACGSGTKGGNGDMAMAGGPDMASGCVMNPVSATDILNACTDAETGEATKDAPYYPSLTPGGVLPALP